MFDQPGALAPLLDAAFANTSVVVLGDVMLDVYVRGEVGRISPEAPVPVLRERERSSNAGGAANVAANLAKLGAKAQVIGLAADDAAGRELRSALESQGIGTAGVLAEAGRPTTTKTRIVGGSNQQQMLRLDVEDARAASAAASDALITATTRALAAGAKALIISDYGKGVVSPGIAQAAIAAARQRGVPVLVDPKGRDFAKYAGATTVTPNLGELALATGKASDDLDGLIAGARAIIGNLGLRFMTFTRGEHGISLIEPSNVTHIPAQAQEVYDVSGAGDAVIAVMGICLASGVALADAARLANLAGGIVVGKPGTVPVTLDELRERFAHHAGLDALGKRCTWDAAKRRIRAWQAAGERVAFTNGCFDVLHAGHVHLLQQARASADRLVLAINADASVRRLKGPTRPVNNQDDRATVLAALAMVDLLVIFDEDTPLECITALRPDVLVKGADYSEAAIVGAAEVKSWGGTVLRAELLPGRSSTNTLSKLKSC